MLRQELIPIKFTMTLFGVRAKVSAVLISTDEKLSWARIILSTYLVKQFTKNEAVSAHKFYSIKQLAIVLLGEY